MTIERKWNDGPGTKTYPWTEVDEDRASRDLAKKFGDDALAKLKEKKALETQYAQYRITD